MLVYLQMIESPADRDKFTILYERYRSYMFRVAVQILENTEDAEDAVHEAFLYLARNLDHVQQLDSPRTKGYVAIISEHCAIDILRKRKRVVEIPLEKIEQTVSVTLPPEEALGELISQLKPLYREILFLRYRFGYSEKDIARQLGVSYSSVRKDMERARAVLKKALEGGQSNGSGFVD